ncbi:MAG: response regulator transcription factor [Ignavibacteriaceae bacterium]
MKLKISKPSAIAKLYRLTKRERQVFELIYDGFTDKEIAEKLHMSNNTVKKHNNNRLEKLALQTRTKIAQFEHTSNIRNTVMVRFQQSESNYF